jgi:predicted PurR-regulated permease PerM
VPKRLENTSLAIAAVAILGAVYFGRSVLAPVACALFIMALAWPLQCRLQAHLPKLSRLGSSFSPSPSCLVGFGWLLAWGLDASGDG